jgi:hypothetical protein
VFNWTEVVQWYSNTLGGVMADNTLTDVNVLNGGNVGNASVGAYGACCESTNCHKQLPQAIATSVLSGVFVSAC